MTDPVDRELAGRLEDLARADGERAPSFGAVLARRRPSLAPGRLAVAGAGLLAIVAAVWLTLPEISPSPVVSASAAAAMTSWTSPTDALLDTPGRGLLAESPVLGDGLELTDSSPPARDRTAPGVTPRTSLHEHKHKGATS